MWSSGAPVFAIVAATIAVGYSTSENHKADTPKAEHVYLPNCDTARALGYAPMGVGEPGYRSALDADGDGVACERYHGR
jgi:hypothetical protein